MPDDVVAEVEAALQQVSGEFPGHAPWDAKQPCPGCDFERAQRELHDRAPEWLRRLCARVRIAEEWRDSVLGKLKTFPEFAETVWGGEKGNEGWGWAFEFIGWLYHDHKRLEAEVAQLRADGQRLRDQAQAVVKAGWALSDVGPFLPDTANGRAFGEVLDALEICLRETAGNAP